MTSQGFINRVIDNFKHHVMQSGAIAGIADIHARAFANRFEAFQYLDTVGVVFLALRLLVIGH